MMNLIIGLCVGLAAAVALAVMWRMAERLRKELQSRESTPLEKKASRREEAFKDPLGDS
jgi:capsular polysaccharide biosynthesis protein